MGHNYEKRCKRTNHSTAYYFAGSASGNPVFFTETGICSGESSVSGLSGKCCFHRKYHRAVRERTGKYKRYITQAGGKLGKELHLQFADICRELVYKGVNVTMGYAMSYKELALPDERGGALETGDMAYRDRDGFFYIAGRKKRFLKVYGNRLNLDEMDGLLREAGYEAVTAGKDSLFRTEINACEADLYGPQSGGKYI